MATAKNTKATETTETTTTNQTVTLTKQSGPLPQLAEKQTGTRDGSIPALVKSLQVGEWFAVELKDGKTNTSKSANIMVAARKNGIALKRVRSADGKDIYQRVEAPADEPEAEKTDATE